MAAPAGEIEAPRASLRARVQVLLARETRTPVASAIRVVMIAAIVLNTLAIVLATVRSLHGPYAGAFARVDNAALLLFALDWLARLWTAPEEAQYRDAGPGAARLAYLRSPIGVIDALAVLPLALAPLFGPDSDWYRVVRLLAVLKIARYSEALMLFVTVIRNESRVLLSALLAMCVVWVLVSGVIFALEHAAQPEVFSSLPQAMWWAIVTMATVGYGDIVPVTAGGKVFGGLVMVLGIASVAVPAGILATGFSSELHKRRTMISWQMVAKVPLFAHLEAARIAAIARLLKLDVVPPRYTIVMRGEPGDAMFFIVSGQVEVQIEPQPLRLGAGQYFGEIALLQEVPRTATVVSVTECELLVLAAADFRRLQQEYPALRDAIREVAERRLGH